MSAPRVLIVDDWLDCLPGWTRGLQRFGYEVRTTHDPRQALPLARSFQPHVMFVDRMMPGMSGEDVYWQTRSDPSTAHIPFVQMACGFAVSDFFYCLNIGMECFIEKPIMPQDWAMWAAMFTPKGIAAEAALPGYEHESVRD